MRIFTNTGNQIALKNVTKMDLKTQQKEWIIYFKGPKL